MTFAPQQRRPTKIPSGLRRIVFWVLIMVLAAGIWRESPAGGTRGAPSWLVDFVLVFAFFGVGIFIFTVWQIIRRRRTSRGGPENLGQPTRAAVPPGFLWLEFGILAITAAAVLWSKRPSSRIHLGLYDFALAFAFIGASAFIVMIWQAIARSKPARAGEQNRPVG